MMGHNRLGMTISMNRDGNGFQQPNSCFRSYHRRDERIEAFIPLLNKDYFGGCMARKNKLHPTRQRALDSVWRKGLSGAQVKIVNALNKRFNDTADEPSLYEIVELTGLSYGAVWTNLAVLEHFGYVVISRDHKGRALHRGVNFMHGFDLSESE